MPQATARRIVITAYDGVSLLDLAGRLEAFRTASAFFGGARVGRDLRQAGHLLRIARAAGVLAYGPGNVWTTGVCTGDPPGVSRQDGEEPTVSATVALATASALTLPLLICGPMILK